MLEHAFSERNAADARRRGGDQGGSARRASAERRGGCARAPKADGGAARDHRANAGAAAGGAPCGGGEPQGDDGAHADSRGVAAKAQGHCRRRGSQGWGCGGGPRRHRQRELQSIQELQQKMQKLEGAATAAPGMGVPVQAPGMNNVVKCPPPPPRRRAAAPATPKRSPSLRPGSTRRYRPSPRTQAGEASPGVHPSIEIKDDAAAPAPATPPGWGERRPPRLPRPLPRAAGWTPRSWATTTRWRRTLPRIATGREVMMQGFNWESHKFDWYTIVASAVGGADVGFTQIWLPLHGLAARRAPCPQPPLAQQQMQRRGRFVSSGHCERKTSFRARRGAQPPLRDAPGRGWEVEHVEGPRHGLG